MVSRKGVEEVLWIVTEEVRIIMMKKEVSFVTSIAQWNEESEREINAKLEGALMFYSSILLFGYY